MADNPSKKTSKPEIPNTLAGAAKAPPFDSRPGPSEVQRVVLDPSGAAVPTPDQALWGAIRNRTSAASFNNFEKLVELAFCRDVGGEPAPMLRTTLSRLQPRVSDRQEHCYHGPEAYNLLKAVAEIFIALQCGVKVEPLPGPDGEPIPRNAPIPGEAGRGSELDTYEELIRALALYVKPSTLPYLQRIIGALKLLPAKSPLCDGLLQDPGCYPCLLELIWSYWHEEGMLVQSMNALCLRFQNKRSPHLRDPLANLRLTPLRPLNTVLWGYIQDEVNRLTVARRAYEYDHEYGLRLVGKAVPDLQTVDSRSKFLEAFHNLLYVTSRFYKEADDSTVRADAFPVLNALRELHLILAQGAHNQFGDLPWTARVEMMIQKWLLSRPEIREFLGGAPMVPYKEGWMAHVDAMKTLQGWSDVSVSHYRDLAVYGEQILLSVRYGDWIDDVVTQANAYNWAVSWRPEIQSYIHSYRAVSGVDLSSQVTDSNVAARRFAQPSLLQQNRMSSPRVAANGRVAAGNGQHEFSPV